MTAVPVPVGPVETVVVIVADPAPVVVEVVLRVEVSPLPDTNPGHLIGAVCGQITDVARMRRGTTVSGWRGEKGSDWATAGAVVSMTSTARIVPASVGEAVA